MRRAARGRNGGRLTIADVEVVAVRGMLPPRATPFQRQVRALDQYGHPQEVAAYEAVSANPERGLALYLRLRSAQGPEGFYGPIDEPAAWAIMHVLRSFVIGEDALAGNVLSDKLQRFDRHARHGYLKMAISALDNAVWDLRGRAFDAPVWQLLGGAARDEVPAYASTLGRPHDAGRVEATALELRDGGFCAQKWFFRFGPANGPAGLEENIDLVERLRSVLGRGAEVMFDAFMGWDLRYAQAWASAVSHLAPSWLEEPLAAGHYAAYEELRRAVGVPLAAGEHLYDRMEVLPFLQKGILSVLQSDPEWCGGVTELIRVCALAETFGVPVIPHGHGLHAALHVVASQSPEVCPMMEYLIEVMPRRHAFDRGAPMPVKGRIRLPSAPGFGIELDEDCLDEVAPWTAR